MPLGPNRCEIQGSSAFILDWGSGEFEIEGSPRTFPKPNLRLLPELQLDLGTFQMQCLPKLEINLGSTGATPDPPFGAKAINDQDKHGGQFAPPEYSFGGSLGDMFLASLALERHHPSPSRPRAAGKAHWETSMPSETLRSPPNPCTRPPLHSYISNSTSQFTHRAPLSNSCGTSPCSLILSSTSRQFHSLFVGTTILRACERRNRKPDSFFKRHDASVSKYPSPMPRLPATDRLSV